MKIGFFKRNGIAGNDSMDIIMFDLSSSDKVVKVGLWWGGDCMWGKSSLFKQFYIGKLNFSWS